MAISINTNKPATPIIKITGTQYDETTEVSTAYVATSVTTSTVLTDANTVSKSSILSFVGDVSFTIATTGDSYTDATYSSTADFVGKKNMGSDNKVGNIAETYYTLNGKDPVRTKAYLYKGQAITLKTNKSGSDNTIIKARKYVAGQWSDIAVAEIKVIKTVGNQF
jgi:hypothetical protein